MYLYVCSLSVSLSLSRPHSLSLPSHTLSPSLSLLYDLSQSLYGNVLSLIVCSGDPASVPFALMMMDRGVNMHVKDSNVGNRWGTLSRSLSPNSLSPSLFLSVSLIYLYPSLSRSLYINICISASWPFYLSLLFPLRMYLIPSVSPQHITHNFNLSPSLSPSH